MKRFKHIFRAFLAVLLINLTTQATAQDFQVGQENPASNTHTVENKDSWLDSVDISLLTCGPGQEVWSYYGHTALRIEDKAHGNDLAVNWGMFSFNQDFFILRFVFGLTDYQIGVFPMSRFIEEYTYEGRWVKQQRLALTREEKLKILKAIDENNQEANRTYRYNFFYDNCTTRARNMITNHLAADGTDFKNTDAQSTYRKEIHRWNKQHRWARFGNDLLLGYLADRPITKQEWEFLPENLMQDFETEARKDTVSQNGLANNTTGVKFLIDKDRYIKLIDSTFYILPPQTDAVETEAITPRMVAVAIALIIMILCGLEVACKKNFWWLDTILLTLTGLPGLILLVMVFSQHPTVQVNFQILLFNPLNLFFVIQVSRKAKKGGFHWYYNVWGWLIVLALFLQIWQDYAEGMVILALSLLMRYAMRSALYDLKLFTTKKK